MSPTNQMNTHPANLAPSTYSPVESVVSHDYAGVQKNRKQASTGGGRAWSEDEEVYLLQTRLQKMPYKHIASHLKKTELACRLHYHQLSHGSGNRRKRTSSVSPSTSSTQHSPVMHSMPSPVNQHVPIAVGTYAPQSPQHIQLPSLTQGGSPPRLQNHPIAILPKPSPPRRAISDSTLRLDTTSSAQSIDTARLRAIYEAHRASFWSQIAAEYGCGASPFALEESWKSCIVSNAPPTPDSAYAKMAPVQEPKKDATSISALLGIDASPRSPKEREMIRRMEERRGSMVMPRDILMAGVESA